MDDTAERNIAYKKLIERIPVDLEKVKEKTKETYTTLLIERPSAVPWGAFAKAVADSESKYASVFKSILISAPQLMDIEEIAYIEKLEDSEDTTRITFVEECTQSLESIGLHLSAEELTTSLSEDPKYMAVKKSFENTKNLEDEVFQIVARIQEEYANVAHATRIFEEARLLLRKYAPSVPWPQKKCLCISEQQFLPNGGWSIRKKGGHLLSIKDPSSDLNTCLKESKTTRLTEDMFYKTILISASHEAGHASFAEIFDPGDINDVFSTNSNVANLSWSLAEGYGIVEERVMADILLFLNPRSLDNQIDFVQNDISERKDYLWNVRGESDRRVYTDGDRIMRRLVLQLGLYNKPREEQLAGLNDFLKNLDLQKAARIKTTDKEYLAILRNPIENLPMNTN